MKKLGGDIKRFRFMHRALGTEKRERNGEENSRQKGKHWQYTPEKLDELDKAGEIYWSPTGNPRRMVYCDPQKGIPVQDIWLDYRDSINQSQRTTGYPTEKNYEMLRMIIGASSNKGRSCDGLLCREWNDIGGSL